jgi:hypothetical protein
MAYRDHEPISIDQFNGLYDRGDSEECPPDHFTEVENIRFVGSTAFATRFGVGQHQNVAVPLGNIVRLYNYITQDGNTLLVLTYDGTDGEIYHVVDSTTVFGPILTIPGMEDFGFADYAGRAYITPFASFQQGAVTIEKGLQNEFLYVYDGSLNPGTPARTVGVAPPVGTLVVAAGAAGNMDAGIHIYGVVFETDTGALSAPAAFAAFSSAVNVTVSFSSIPISPSSAVTKRHIVATKVLTVPFTPGNFLISDYFFIPNATVNDNVTTTLNNVGFFDSALLADATYLLDNYSVVPAGVNLFIYHNRLCLCTTFTDISLVLVSSVGEPESFSQLDGLLVVPPDGNPITNGRELRDVLYITKRNKTVSFVDNDDAPSSWPMSVVDNAYGASVHGIATVIDSGSGSVDYLILANGAGIFNFNGRFAVPELSWKIKAFWKNSNNQNEMRLVQMVNDSLEQVLYCVLTNGKLLIGNYSNGFNPKDLRWAPWKFDFRVNTVALININELILGSSAGL